MATGPGTRVNPLEQKNETFAPLTLSTETISLLQSDEVRKAIRAFGRKASPSVPVAGRGGPALRSLACHHCALGSRGATSTRLHPRRASALPGGGDPGDRGEARPTACPAYPGDLLAKIERARALGGTRFLHILCPCVPGWGIADDTSLRVARLAVESRLFPLYEVRDGLSYTITHEPVGLPVKEYLSAQARYRHLTDEAIRQIQEDVDQGWARLVGRARALPPRAPV